MLTYPEDDSPSQLSSVAGTPREQYAHNRSMRLHGGSRGGITGVEDSQLSSVAIAGKQIMITVILLFIYYLSQVLPVISVVSQH
jgi:hypothetical protein